MIIRIHTRSTHVFLTLISKNNIKKTIGPFYYRSRKSMKPINLVRVLKCIMAVGYLSFKYDDDTLNIFYMGKMYSTGELKKMKVNR